MNLHLNVAFIACLILGAAGGLESRLAGRKLAIATHMAATSLGYFAVAICHTSIEISFGLSSAPLYALALAWSAPGFRKRIRCVRAKTSKRAATPPTTSSPS